MEGSREGSRRTTHQPLATTKVERKVMEKNRRNQMKMLFSKLNSLLPNQHSNELPLTVSNQIDEAINYIKSLETKVKRQKEKKEGFLRRKRSLSSTAPRSTVDQYSEDGRNSPKLKIREMGSAVEVILTSGLDDQCIFYEIIHILHEERAQIINASYSFLESTVFYTLHAEIEDVVYEFGATKLTERLKRFVYEWASDNTEMQAATMGDHGGGIDPETWPAASTSTTSGRHFWNHEI